MPHKLPVSHPETTQGRVMNQRSGKFVFDVNHNRIREEECCFLGLSNCKRADKTINIHQLDKVQFSNVTSCFYPLRKCGK